MAWRTLASAKAGLVIHGIGGVGKRTLAAEAIAGAGGQHVVLSLRGALAVDTILDELGARVNSSSMNMRRVIGACQRM